MWDQFPGLGIEPESLHWGDKVLAADHQRSPCVPVWKNFRFSDTFFHNVSSLPSCFITIVSELKGNLIHSDNKTETQWEIVTFMQGHSQLALLTRTSLGPFWQLNQNCFYSYYTVRWYTLFLFIGPAFPRPHQLSWDLDPQTKSKKLLSTQFSPSQISTLVRGPSHSPVLGCSHL